MTHPDQARVEGLIERLRTDVFYLRNRVSATLRTIANDIDEAANALSELLSLRASPSAGEPVEGRADKYGMHDPALVKAYEAWWEVMGFPDGFYVHVPHKNGDGGKDVLVPYGQTMMSAVAAAINAYHAGAPSPSAVTREPSGWKLVPVEATPEMLGAWYRYKNGHHYHDEPAPVDTSDVGAYRAMLAASPEPETQPVEGWQPIETAPRTGEGIWLLQTFPREGKTPAYGRVIGYWRPASWNSTLPSERWISSETGEEIESAECISHWQRLPPLPAPKEPTND